ncbi:MAG: GNAT family N-acetyltransferase [Desulfobacteraceae bacterium]|nr:GNAT family N-acetyltransferase [Desulfobacteraceae bacterium]
MKIHIQIPPGSSDLKWIRDHLIEYNKPHIGDIPREQLAALVKDDNGRNIGGISGFIIGDWLQIDLLVIREDYRGKGIGTRLLLALEGTAVDRGCKTSFLDTLDFQAKPFYEKNGYRVVFEKPNFPRTHCCYYLQKPLRAIDKKQVMPGKLLIREATTADFGIAGILFSEENRFHTELLPDIFQVAVPIMTHQWYDGIIENPRKKLYIAEKKGKAVGLILMVLKSNPKDSIFARRNYIFIDEIMVTESCRGQGIGRKLMALARKWAKEKKVRIIELNTWEKSAKARQFYDTMGFKTVRRILRLEL